MELCKEYDMKDRKKIEFQSVADLPPMAMSLKSMAANPTGSWRNLRPVINYADCIRCFICWKYCPDVAIDLEGEDKPVINLTFCKGCGICAEECPKKCIAMTKEGK
jgi:2-oxoacid:acceptor oxidoreductase delta subunit (pyruvate/2-ketoisovalerate family)